MKFVLFFYADFSVRFEEHDEFWKICLSCPPTNYKFRYLILECSPSMIVAFSLAFAFLKFIDSLRFSVFYVLFIDALIFVCFDFQCKVWFSVLFHLIWILFWIPKFMTNEKSMIARTWQGKITFHLQIYMILDCLYIFIWFAGYYYIKIGLEHPRPGNKHVLLFQSFVVFSNSSSYLWPSNCLC